MTTAAAMPGATQQLLLLLLQPHHAECAKEPCWQAAHHLVIQSSCVPQQHSQPLVVVVWLQLGSLAGVHEVLLLLVSAWLAAEPERDGHRAENEDQRQQRPPQARTHPGLTLGS